MRRVSPLAAALLVANFNMARSQAPPPQLRGADAYIIQAMRDWEVPGLAIAVVKDDSLIWARGFGVRELGKNDPVDINTIFLAASTTKAFTAAMMAMLVDSNRVRWDDPVRRHLPEFQVGDPYITQEMTIRDLLSHRSGFSRADALWYGTTLSRNEIRRRLQFQEPGSSFRSRYGYNNNMFLTAGELIARMYGAPWDRAVQRWIFEPLGMTRSSTTIVGLDTMANVATPHGRFEQRMQTIAWRNVDNIGGAGSINTTVRDMAQWLRLQLGNGSFNGRRLLSEAQIREMRLPNTPIRPEPRTDSIYPEIHLRAYGLGWSLADYRGRLVVHHGGALDGMRAQVALLPEERLGVVLLANSNQTASLLVGLEYRIFDAFTGGVRRDWSADLLAVLREDRRRADREEHRLDSLRVRGSQPSHRLAEYAGRYVDSLFGEMAVTEEAGHLVARFGNWATGDLEHWHYDTFRVTWRDRESGTDMISFGANVDSGVIDRLVVKDLGDFGRMAEARR